MRKKTAFEGKNHIYDTEKANELKHRTVGEFGDPAGYEETLYQTRGGLYFAYGIGGAESPYGTEGDIKPLTAEEAEADTWE
jgi:hypothetical protein